MKMAFPRFPLKLLTFCIILEASVSLSPLSPILCPCDDANLCRPLKVKKNTKFEVYAFSNGLTNIDSWDWDTITTLVVPSTYSTSNKTHLNSMCTAHKHGRKFGVTVELNLTGPLDFTSPEADQWIESVVATQSSWSADVLNLNLLPYFKSDHDSSRDDHIQLVTIINNLHMFLDNVHKMTGATIELSCTVPWKPPCAAEEASCVFSHVITTACDFFIISPESFLDVEDEKCRASATIPFSKLVYGISEYNAHQIPSNRIVLGVTWHGYDYICKDLTNDVCTVETVNVENSTVTKCDFSKRKRLTYGDIVKDHPEFLSDPKKNELYNAPYFQYKDGSVNHQVWFEDHSSLISKYRLVKELSLAGMGIIYGDDLGTSKNLMSNKGAMWSWVAHEFLLLTSQSDRKSDLHCADTVAGVAVGCLFLGCILGVVFTCIILHKKLRKPKQPFLRDADTGADEYTDEDPNL